MPQMIDETYDGSDGSGDDEGSKSGRRSKEQLLRDIFEESHEEFMLSESQSREVRKQCLQDRRFYSIPGAMWEGPLSLQFDNRPKLEANKVMLAVMRIINEYRANNINVTFVSQDVGSYDTDLADSASGMFRADDTTPAARESKNNAFEEAVGGGIGAWRLRAVMVNEDDPKNTKQKPVWEPIYDADSCVFWNVGSKRQDKSDATKCWVLTPYTIDSFIDEWPDEDPVTWPKTTHQGEFDWVADKTVYVAEYYCVERKKQTLFVYRTIDGEEESYTQDELKADPELEDHLLAIGHQLSRKETIRKPRVHKYLMSGCGILEDCGYIAGTNIPIIMAYGKRWVVDNIERCMGHVALAKDTQRVKNMQMSKLAEISAAAGVEKPVFFEDELTAGLAELWANDNVNNKPYLIRKRAYDINQNVIPQQLEYTRSPSVPPATAALLQVTDQDLADLLGNQEAGEELQANTSGFAIELIQAKLDMQTFIYISNMEIAVARSAEVWLGMAKELYVEDDRKVRSIQTDGSKSVVQLNRPILDPDTKAVVYENDLSKANFAIETDVGPQSASRRATIVRNLLGMIQLAAASGDTESANIMIAYAMMNLEGEGLGEMRTFFRSKLIKMGVAKPTPEEQQELAQEAANTPPAKPDPQDTFLQASAVKTLADAAVSKAKANNLDADTATKLVSIDHANQEQILRAFEHIDDAAAKAQAIAASQDEQQQAAEQGANQPAPDQQAE